MAFFEKKVEKNAINLTNSKHKEKKPFKFIANDKYFSFCIYSLIVIAVGAMLVRVIMTPYAVTRTIHNILNVIMPFIVGILIAMILDPLIFWLVTLMHDKLKIRSMSLCKVLAMLLSYICVLSVIIMCLLFIIPQVINSITGVINSLPGLYNVVAGFFNRVQEYFPNTDISEARSAITKVLPDFISTIQNFTNDLIPAIYSTSVSVISVLLNFLIAIIVSIYMLSDKKNLLHGFRRILYAFVPVRYIEATEQVLRDCGKIFSGFLVGKALDSAIIGVLCFILMTILRLDYALLISVIVGVTNMIPYFGPFIGAVPGVLFLLMISPWKALIFVIMILVLQQFDGLILGPKILGDSIGIKPLWIIISITVGGSIGGVLGMFLSVPIVAIIAYLFDMLVSYRLNGKNYDAKTLMKTDDPETEDSVQTE